MNYELAKKLKEAGFPQRFSVMEGYYYEMSGQTLPTVKNPTLSELIEACGEDFTMLSKDKKIWYAHGITSRAYEPNGDIEDEYMDTFDGRTPEEAVAKLWLALNKK